MSRPLNLLEQCDRCGHPCDADKLAYDGLGMVCGACRVVARKPRRIQLRRTAGWKKPPGVISVARPSKWGNPFKLGGPSGLAREPAIHHPDEPWEYEGRISAAGMQHDYHHPGGRITRVMVREMTAAESVECYRAYVTGGGWPIDWQPHGAPTVAIIRAELRGHDLACWCPLDQPCHADVLLELARGARY